MRRSLAGGLALAVAAAGVLLADPAEAHQEITPGSVPAGRPAFLFLSAANEKQVDLTRVSIDPPAGAQFGHATKDPEGWTAALTHTNVTWTGGSVRPGRFEQFGFDVEPFGQPGAVAFRVTFGFADGTSQQVEVPLTVAQGGDAGAATSTVPTTVAATPETTSEVTTAPSPAVSDDDGGSDGLATVAIVLAVVAIVTSVASALASRRRSGPAPAAAGGGQDW